MPNPAYRQPSALRSQVCHKQITWSSRVGEEFLWNYGNAKSRLNADVAPRTGLGRGVLVQREA
jgi:hypothetical protein